MSTARAAAVRRQRQRRRWFRGATVIAVLVVLLGGPGSVGAEGGDGAPVPTPLPRKAEPPVPFGRVIYRATKTASFESLGVTVIACRHRDPVVRRFMVEFFDVAGRKVQTFGAHIAEVPAGKKLVFVTDGRYFKNRDVSDVRLGHLTGGPARIISDAEVVRCGGKIRFDGGYRHPSYWNGIGLYREGEPAPTEKPW